MEGGFAMTLTQTASKSSGKSIIRKIPLDITFAEKKIGKGAFGRTCSIVYSQMKYWWKYAKWNYDNKIWFYKSQKELAAELGMSEKTIWRALKKLRELGLLLVAKHHSKFWRQVYFYSLVLVGAASGATTSTKINSTDKNYRGTSNRTNKSNQQRQNDCIQHKKTNPLKEIIKRATQYHELNGKNQKAKLGFGNAEINCECKKCRGSGLIDNPQNIALRCDCEAGRRMNNMIPMFNDMEVLAAA